MTAIVSTGRTGTQFLAGFVAETQPDALALHEPAPDLFDVGVGYRRGELGHDQAVRRTLVARASQRRRLATDQRPVYVESNNNLALLLPVAAAAFRRFRVVQVVREPTSYLASAFSKTHGAERYSLYSENDPRARLRASDDASDPFAAAWTRFGRFEKLCWHWRKYNELIEEIRRRCRPFAPDRVRGSVRAGRRC